MPTQKFDVDIDEVTSAIRELPAAIRSAVAKGALKLPLNLFLSERVPATGAAPTNRVLYRLRLRSRIDLLAFAERAMKREFHETVS